jgi:hypothetical protein
VRLIEESWALPQKKLHPKSIVSLAACRLYSMGQSQQVQKNERSEQVEQMNLTVIEKPECLYRFPQRYGLNLFLKSFLSLLISFCSIYLLQKFNEAVMKNVGQLIQSYLYVFAVLIPLSLIIFYSNKYNGYHKSKKLKRLHIYTSKTSFGYSETADLNSVSFVPWEQIIALRFDTLAHQYVCSLSGSDETEIRFPKHTDFRNVLPSVKSVKEVLPLELLLQQNAPALRHQQITILDNEALTLPQPHAAYPIEGTKVYTYNIQKNITSERATKIHVGIFALITSLIYYHCIFIEKLESEIFYIILFITLLLFPVIFISVFQQNRIYKNSQIEIDNLGISYVICQKIKWRVAWLSIVKFGIDGDASQYVRRYMIETRDGKKYSFVAQTAKIEELLAEIYQHIALNKPQ